MSAISKTSAIHFHRDRSESDSTIFRQAKFRVRAHLETLKLLEKAPLCYLCVTLCLQFTRVESVR